mmetsp:Transcript_22878/g.55520  ORF Transcript_22878/g.55520 Transcript_22878/m.55520 type:complete len:169 (+) Transcript_22878:450-956(+)
MKWAKGTMPMRAIFFKSNVFELVKAGTLASPLKELESCAVFAVLRIRTVSPDVKETSCEETKMSECVEHRLVSVCCTNEYESEGRGIPVPTKLDWIQGLIIQGGRAGDTSSNDDPEGECLQVPLVLAGGHGFQYGDRDYKTFLAHKFESPGACNGRQTMRTISEMLPL